MNNFLIKRFLLTFFTLAILVTVPSISFGQWILGVRGGFVNSKLQNTPDVYGGNNYKGGAEVGIVISKKLKVDFAFESGIFFSQAGFHQLFNQENKETYYHPVTNARITVDSFFRYDNTLSLNYLKIPLMLRKSISIKGSNLYPYRRKISITDIDIMFGPYVAYMMSSSASFDTKVSVKTIEDGTVTSTVPETGMNDPYHQSFKIGQGVTITSTDPTTIPVGPNLYPFLPARASLSEGLNKFDAGIMAAVGLSFELSSSVKLMLGGNYSMGLLTFDKEYFSDLEYVVSPGGTIDIGGGTMVSISKNVSKKMELKNTSLGAYVAVVKYFK
jgi:hypothetical protein